MASDIYFYIVRGPAPSYKTKMPIELAQIEALAKTRADMEVQVGETGSRAKRDMIVVNPADDLCKVLTLIDGRLQVRNPNERTLLWMLDLAQALNARVRDNMVRTYKTPSEKFIHPEDVVAREKHLAKVKAAGSPWIPDSTTIMKWAIIGAFIVAGVIAKLTIDG